MTMDVATLRAQLADLPDDMPVVLANSAEGNGFSPLHIVDDALYCEDSPYSGEWYATPEMRAARTDSGDWAEAPDRAVPAVFLWPAS